MSMRRWMLWVLSSAGLIVGTGCGGGTTSTNTTGRVVNGNLAGNWLITGSLPTVTVGGALATVPNLALTFDVVGTQAVATGMANVPCGSGVPSVRSGVAVSGPIATDGSFTAQSTSVSGAPLLSLSIQGNVPKASEGVWNGNYTLTMNSPSCSATFSGPFTASPIQMVSGTYAGTQVWTILGTNGVATRTPVTIHMNLQQGAPLVTSQGVVGPYSNLGLTGSIQVQGLSCLTTGTVSTKEPSAVEGNVVLASFDMNDGSLLGLVGTVTDMGATRLSMASVVLSGGTCGVVSSTGATEFDRQ